MSKLFGLKDEEVLGLAAVAGAGIWLAQSGWLARRAGEASVSAFTSILRRTLPPYLTELSEVELPFFDPASGVFGAAWDVEQGIEHYLTTPAAQGLEPGQTFDEAYPGYDASSLWDRFRLGWNITPLGGLWAMQ